MDAEEQSGMGVQTVARPEKTVWKILAYEHEVRLECDDKGKVRGWE
mgnify:CR=1 FL=1